MPCSSRSRLGDPRRRNRVSRKARTRLPPKGQGAAKTSRPEAIGEEAGRTHSIGPDRLVGAVFSRASAGCAIVRGVLDCTSEMEEP